MPLQQRLVVAGISSVQAQAQCGTVQNNLTATGSTQATAFPVPADVNRFTTVAASTGAVLPPMNPGDEVQIINAGANALLVYPPPGLGAIINGLGANAGYSVATATPSCFVQCVTPTIFAAQQSA
jgi:hypothetical protein